MLVAGHVRGRRQQPGRGADRSRNAEPQAVGDSPVIAPVGGVRAVEIRPRCRQHQGDPRADRLPRDKPGGLPGGQPVPARHLAHRADRAPRQHPARRGHERHRHRRPALPGAAQPARQGVPQRRGRRLVTGPAQPDQLAQPRGAPGSAGEQLPAAHQRPPSGGAREARGAVPHHRRQAAGHCPPGNGDAVPASRGRRARLRSRIQQQVAGPAGPPGSAARRGGRPGAGGPCRGQGREPAQAGRGRAHRGLGYHRGTGHQHRNRGSHSTPAQPSHHRNLPGRCPR